MNIVESKGFDAIVQRIASNADIGTVVLIFIIFVLLIMLIVSMKNYYALVEKMQDQMTGIST